METYQFDREISRKHTNSLKYDFAVERGYPENVLPLWVADMDFRAAEPILDALHRAVDHGIFGYSEVKGEYYDAVAGWFRDRFGWETKPEWLVKTPGVVYALAMAIRACTKEGDSVLIQPPVYYPFASVIRDNGRRVAENRLAYRNGHYEIDFDDFEEKIKKKKVKLFILCSPHNPVGRVWTEEELRRMGDICLKYDVTVVSDEIHCDFALPGHPHTVFLKACPDLAQKTVVCTSPSKTFNLAGLQVSNIWIPSRELRRKFQKEMDGSGYFQLNALGLVAAQAAYESGGPWLDQCRRYLQENLDFLRDFLRERIPQIRLAEPEGTYFAWLDCSGLGLDGAALDAFISHKAGLWLDAGHIFGKDAASFQRMVLACPRKTLERALLCLEKAVKEDFS